MIAWGSWILRNHTTFKNSLVPINKLAVEGVVIYKFIPNPQQAHPSRVIHPEKIKRTIPWAYFDGASDPQDRCRAELVIHFPSGKSLKASVGLGQGTNIFSDLKALRLLCCLTLLRCREVQIFGDSLHIFKWFNGTQRCLNYILHPLLNEVSRLKILFNEISVCHIYRERNHEADLLSKEGIQHDLGLWVAVKVEDGLVRNLEQPLFN